MRAVASAFFLALVGPIVFEIRLSFPDFVDDDVVSLFLIFVFLLLLLHPVHLFGVCFPQFRFVTVMLHFATTFIIAMI